MENGIIMQYFEWYLPPDGNHWNRLKNDAKHLSDIGITAVWLPPAYKGANGIFDVGYSVYDMYDLGEFDQKGSVSTKYGTNKEYIEAVDELHKYGIDVYADIVFNQRIGADGTEIVRAIEDNPQNREQQTSGIEEIEAWTRFDFLGRNNTYSDFKLDWKCFHGVDYDERTKRSSIFLFEGKHWDENVDRELGNYDYLMGADTDFDYQPLKQSLFDWIDWYVDTANIDGFRIDAVKHIKFEFFKEWLSYIRNSKKREFFAVGEYWSKDLARLQNYLGICENAMSLFDVPLHFKFFEASASDGNMDMSKLLDGTLVSSEPTKAVTFVENHDTQEGQALQSAVLNWFKPSAYAVTLLRNEGYPCIFYGDYYGVPSHNEKPFMDILDKLLWLRKEKAFGSQNDYFDDFDVVGWTREGDDEHIGSGLAVLITDKRGGVKKMYIGKRNAGKIFYDCIGNCADTVTIDKDGYGVFEVSDGSVSVWILKNE